MAATRGRKWMRMKIPSCSKHTCIYCGMIWTGGDTCPRCGERVREEMDQSIGLMGEEK